MSGTVPAAIGYVDDIPMLKLARPARGRLWSLNRRVRRLKYAGAVRFLFGADDVHHGVDQREVGERLREVAQVTARPGLDLLRVQVQRAGE